MIAWAVGLLLGAVPSPSVDPSLFSELQWRLIGPFRGGRTVAVTGVPGERGVFFAAAVNGGVWKSTDYGTVWRPIFDSASSGSVGAIAVAPSNPQIIYVGSGEGLRRPDLSVGNGIYKSIDQGKTWEHLGLRDGQQIGALLVDPKNAERVFVAVLGHPYGPNTERGVFRSLDGGKTFEKVLYKDENTGAIDLAFDPLDSDTVYASLWTSRRPPWTTGTGLTAPGSGLYKSTDGGSTWHELTGFPRERASRIGIGVAPSDPKRVYIWMSAREDTGLYRSSDAGQTFERVNSEERIAGRGDDFAGVKVDPFDPDTVYVANTSVYRSKDGGKTFTAIKGAPGGDDYHTIWIHPKDPRMILLGSDQGATLSVNGGETWSSWFNQPTAQFYHVSTDNRFPYWVYGGQQESGSAAVASRSDYGIITFREFHTVGVEEYGYVAPDPLNPDLVYGGKVTRFSHSTGQVQDVSPAALRTGKYRFNRTAPLLFSPTDPHTLYLGSQVLFATQDGGHSWNILSPDLTREDPGLPKSLGPFATADTEPHRGVIYTIAPSPKDPSLIWVGTDDGLIHLTRDLGKNWRNVTPPSLTAWSKVSILEASHSDPGTAYAAVNRIRLDDLKPHVLRTRDFGATWDEIVRGLPEDEPVNCVREDPVRKGLLFAGTEGSVYVSFDDGDHWQSLQLNLPHTSMRDLAVHGEDLVVGTHGRSFWILDDVAPLRQLTAEVASAPTHLFTPADAIRIGWNRNTDTPLTPETPHGVNPPEGACLDYVLKNSPKGPVILEILDGTGQLVRRFRSDDPPPSLDEGLNVPTYWIRPTRILPTSRGMHRFFWDLRYPPPGALEHDYPIAAVYRNTPRTPRGPLVIPGTYTVQLIADGAPESAPLRVLPDPRIATSTEALTQERDLSLKISDAMSRDLEALRQVSALKEALAKIEAVGALKEHVDRLARAVRDLDPPAERRGRGTGLSAINRDLATLLEVLDADDLPTTQAVSATADRLKDLAALLSRWKALRDTELPALNADLRRLGKPSVPSRP